MPIPSFSGQTVVVLGGSSGVGFSVAECALAEGAQVVIGSSSSANVEAAVGRLGAGATGRAVDVKDENSVSGFFAAIGPFHHLVFTAGDWNPSLLSHPVASLDFATVNEGLEVRVWGALKAIKHALPQMSAAGSITLTDGVLTHLPRKGASLTTAFGGAIEFLVRGLAVELAPIRVNTVCLGPVLTGHMANAPAEAIRQLTARQVLTRAADPAEAAAAYLYSMRGGFTTGQVLMVDGGAMLV